MNYKLIPVLFCSLLAFGLFAQNKPDSLKTWTLPTVRVVIHSPSEAIGQLMRVDSPGSQAGSLKDALQNLTGISITSGSKDESNLRLRGFRKNEVKIMVDGRPLNNGYFGNVDLSKLSVLDIREIQIIKGPASPQFGSSSMGGVVNIITNSPSRDKWLKLETIFGRNNKQDYRISSSHAFDGFSYNLSGAWQKTDGFVLSENFQPTSFENGGVRDGSNGKRLNLTGGILYELLDFHELGFDFNLSKMDDKHIPSSIYERKRRRYDNWLRESSGLSGKFRLSENILLTTLLSQDRAQDRYIEFNYSNGMEIVSLDSSMRTDSYGIAPKLKIELASDQSLDLGLRSEFLITTRKDNSYYLNWTDNQTQLHSAFVQYGRALAGNVKLNTAMGITLGTNSESHRLSFLPEPALSLEAVDSNGNKTNLAMGISSSQPTMKQLFSADKGNPSLKPQTSVKAELSRFQALIDKVASISGCGFYNRTRNLIDLKNGNYENIFKVDSYGAETELVLTPHNRYQMSVNYFWMGYLRNSNYRLTETPPHAVEIKQTIKLPWRSVLFLNSAYKHNRLSQDDSGNYHTLDKFWKHDASLRIPYRKTNIELGIENILDENYQGEYGFPESGRDYYLSLGISI